MKSVKAFAKAVTDCRWFELGIIAIILLNATFIGMETYGSNPTIAFLQHVILGVFTVEILLRYLAADSNREFFTGGWNLFDLSLVLIGYVPESLFANGAALMALRVLRVFRVLRLLRTADELKLIITVLIKSLGTLFYNGIFFTIFIYLFALVGVSLFRLPDPATLDAEGRARYEKFVEMAPNAPANSPDPFGTLDEACFTLFREITGEDWTDIRYNLLTASKLGIVKVRPAVITCFHVTWFVLSAFLLLNLVVGAVVNNYQAVMEASRAHRLANRGRSGRN